MLSDRQKEQLSAKMIPLFQELEQDVIQDIARRVRKESRWTETAELQAKTLEAMGYKPVEIRNKVMRELKADKEYQAMIAKNTLDYKGAVRDRIKQLVADAKERGDDIVGRAGTMAFNDDLAFWKSKGRHLRHSSELAEINTTASHRLAHELKNLTHSTGFKFVGAPVRIDNAFSHAMDSMIMNVATGAFSSGQATEKVVSDLEKSGIRHVDFRSGISRGIDVAAALAVRTTLGQMAAQISMDNATQLGTDLVEVSSHAGAREGDGHADHAYWQGRVYSISGRQHPEEEKRLGYKIYKLSDVTGYPDDPLGLCGYNCRHTFYPFLEGISEPNPVVKDPEPVTVDGRTYTYYQATQVQRRLERELRELKRQYIGGDETRLAAIKAKEQRYARFCSKAGLKQNLERLYVKGYMRDFEYIKYGGSEQIGKTLSPFQKAEKKVLEHGKKYGTEALIWLDKNGNEVLPFKTGDSNSVGISIKDFLYLNSLEENSIVSLHNHPSCSSFSINDMSIMCNIRSIETMMVIGHDGTRYSLSVGTGLRPSLETIEQTYRDIHGYTLPKYKKMFTETGDEKATWKEHSNEIVRRVAGRFGWNYERIEK